MIEKSYTDEEIAEIVRRHGLPRYPKLALYREKLSRKAKAEPNFRFYCLYGQLLRMDVLRCAYEQVRANKGASGVNRITFGDIERGKDGVGGFLTSIQQELKAKTYRASPVRRKRLGAHSPMAEVHDCRAERREEESQRQGHSARRCRLASSVEHLPALVRDVCRVGRQGNAPSHVDCPLCGRLRDSVLDMRAEKAALGFLGYEFRFVRSHYGEGMYLTFGPSMKSVKKVNWYVRNRLYLHFNRKSQRGYVLKYAPNFYQELQAMGLHMLRRRRK